MCKYPDVFNDKDGRLGCFKHFKADIALAPDAKPFIAKPRQIPLHWEDKVRAKLEEMIKQNVLGWCPPDMCIRFCSALVVVKKKDGSPRITVDFRMLNKYLSRVPDKPRDMSGGFYPDAYDPLAQTPNNSLIYWGDYLREVRPGWDW